MLGASKRKKQVHSVVALDDLDDAGQVDQGRPSRTGDLELWKVWGRRG